jgi:hypothetical protein
MTTAPAIVAAPLPAQLATATHPLTILYHNINGFRGGMHAVWYQQLATANPTQVGTPLLYALVETGEKEPGHPTGWFSSHAPGRKNNRGQLSGGVTIVSHSTCPVERFIIPPILCPGQDMHSTTLAMAVVAPHGSARFLLALAYVPPQVSSHAERMQAVCSAIDTVQKDHSRLPLLVLGDFNAHHPMWHDDRPRSACNGGDTALAEWIDTADLQVHNTHDTPTFVSVRRQPNGTQQCTQSTIDLVLSTPIDLVSDISQRHRTLYYNNDHVPFTLTLDLPNTNPPPNPQLLSRPRIKWDTDRESLRWQRALPAAIARHIAPLQPLLDSLGRQRAESDVDNRNGSPVDPHTTLDIVYGQLEAAVMAACADTVGVKHVDDGASRCKTVPWWTRDVERAFRARNNAFNRLARDKTNEHKRIAALAARRRWKTIVKEAKQRAQGQLATIAMDASSKLRYSTLRRYQKSTFSPLTGVKDDADNMPTSHRQSLDNLCRAFINSSIPPPLVREDPADTYDQLDAASCNDPSNAWQFTAAEISAQTKRRTCKTSAGPDAILPLFLRYGGMPLWTALATVFNYSWRNTTTPQAWREANVTALYKGKGGRSEPLSYRPISVTSGIARTFEHVIHTRLVPIVAPKLSTAQFGFRANRSTTDAILQLLTSLQYLCGITNRLTDKENADNRRRFPTDVDAPEAGQPRRRAPVNRTGENRKLRCAALFLDIQKAFDRVDHDILLARLYHADVRGAAWRWIRCFLSNRRMRCVDNQQESSWLAVRHGVPQGCVLSPLLFLVFINQVVETISTRPDCRLITPTFYADDGVLGPHLWRCRRLLDAVNGQANKFERTYSDNLKAAAQHLNHWCETSRMRFGQDKTKIVVFNRGNRVDNRRYAGIRLCGFEVSITNSYEYLGLLFTTDLTWTRHAEHKCAVARTAATRVTNVAINAQPVQPALIREFVRACVVPAFDYGIEFWGTGLPLDTIRAFQAAVARPLRAALKLPFNTHQQSVLWGYGVPAFITHVQHKQLLHLRRVSGLLHSDPTHPTVELYAKTRTLLVNEHHRLLGIKALMPTPVYLLTAVLPFTHPPPTNPHPPPEANDSLHIAYALPGLTTLVSSSLFSPTTWRRRVGMAFSWASSGKPGVKTAPSRHVRVLALTWAALTAMRTPVLGPGQRTADIHRIRHLAAHAEWLESHMPATQEEREGLPATERNRRTTAPIAGCWHDPGSDDSTSRPLRFLHSRYSAHVRHGDLVRRARLLYGRSYTATTRRRFPTDAAASTAGTICTHPQCDADRVDESIKHLLLHCPYYLAVRQSLRHTLSEHRLSLDLRNILNPPEQSRRRYLALYDATAAYLAAIDTIRQQHQLPGLD